MKKDNCKARMVWHLELPRYEGYVVINEKEYFTGKYRATKKEAIKDAERMQDELKGRL